MTDDQREDTNGTNRPHLPVEDGPTDEGAYRALAKTTAVRLDLLDIEVGKQSVAIAQVQVTTAETRKTVTFIATAVCRYVAVPSAATFLAAFLGTCLAIFVMQHFR